MLMDDAIILASSREALVAKLRILQSFCTSNETVINEEKTKFLVINADENDLMPIVLDKLSIKYCFKYTYLGSIFTSDGKTSSALSEHIKDKAKHYNKLLNFLRKNFDMPFFVKKKVVQAAFNSALLYGCESWLDCGLQPVEKFYVGAFRALLGVRATTCTDLIYVELGIPPVSAVIHSRQRVFFQKMLNERSNMHDDPFIFALNLTRNLNRPTGKIIDSLLSTTNFINEANNKIFAKIRNSEKTRYITYLTLNPDLKTHHVYNTKNYVPEIYRVSFTRFRLSSHNLKIETGRWSRVPREARLCACGELQDERHVIVSCPLTAHIRHNYEVDFDYPHIYYVNLTPAQYKLYYEMLSVFD